MNKKGAGAMSNFTPLLEDDEDDSLAWIDRKPPELEKKSWKLAEGVSSKDWFPDDVIFNLSEDDGIRLADFIPNTIHLMIISERLKKFFESNTDENFEFFPIIILNQKKRKIKDNYFVANLLDSVNCTNNTDSDFEMSSLDPTQVSYFERLVLDEKKIPSKVKIFRLGEMKDLYIIRNELSSAMNAAGMTGMIFQKMEDYGSEFRDPDDD